MLTVAAAWMVLLCTAWTLAGVAAVAWITRRRVQLGRMETLPPVSVLKPLCGSDPSLEENLESCFRQRGVGIELVFGIEQPDDPARAVVESLMERFPLVRARLVVTSGSSGLNPKVRNLRAMLPHATHDLVLISDSNIRVGEQYVAELAAEYANAPERTGIVTNLFRGNGEDTLGAALESVQENGFVAAGAALTTCLGDPIVIGKSMLFSQRRFEKLGGFESVSRVLAEDYVIGKIFQHAGYRVRVAPTVLDNVTRSASLGGFLERQLRWAMLRCRLRPTAYLLEPLASPLVALPFALAAWGPAALGWALAMWGARDVVQWWLLRGPRRAWMAAVLAPWRDLLMLWVWARAPFVKHVSWRGHTVRLSAGTLAYACER